MPMPINKLRRSALRGGFAALILTGVAGCAADPPPVVYYTPPPFERPAPPDPPRFADPLPPSAPAQMPRPGMPGWGHDLATAGMAVAGVEAAKRLSSSGAAQAGRAVVPGLAAPAAGAAEDRMAGRLLVGGTELLEGAEAFEGLEGLLFLFLF
jgi:hypothetical protein